VTQDGDSPLQVLAVMDLFTYSVLIYICILVNKHLLLIQVMGKCINPSIELLGVKEYKIGK